MAEWLPHPTNKMVSATLNKVFAALTDLPVGSTAIPTHRSSSRLFWLRHRFALPKLLLGAAKTACCAFEEEYRDTPLKLFCRRLLVS